MSISRLRINSSCIATKPRAIVSVVLHNNDDVNEFSENFIGLPKDWFLIVTLNTGALNTSIVRWESLGCDYLIVSRLRPISFAKNHNRAFELCLSLFANSNNFLIVNPDVSCDWCEVGDSLRKSHFEHILVPLTFDDNHRPEPIRSFSILSWLWRDRFSLLVKKGCLLPKGYWMPGSFLIVRNHVFLEIGGFDERFKMYMEDVDFFWRAERLGYVCQIADFGIRHVGQRRSRRSFGFALIHMLSFVRFFSARAKGSLE